MWIADRYKDEDAFLGVGLLNEPCGTTDSIVLHQYYLDTYSAIRATGNDCVLVHSPLLWEQDHTHDEDFMEGGVNAWHEWHKYLLWGYEGWSEDEILDKAIPDIGTDIAEWTGNYLYIGEWSLATYDLFTDHDRFITLANTMFAAIDQAHSGWTYWAWRISNDETEYNAWSLRELLRLGLFPFTYPETKPVGFM